MLLCAILALPALAQGRKNVRINEVMVQQDSTGGNGWVEFYNSSYSSTAVEQMFITTLSREEIHLLLKSDTPVTQCSPGTFWILLWMLETPQSRPPPQSSMSVNFFFLGLVPYGILVP